MKKKRPANSFYRNEQSFKIKKDEWDFYFNGKIINNELTIIEYIIILSLLKIAYAFVRIN